MESVRTLIVRLQRPGKVTKREINQRIAALIEQSVTSDGVVNLFDEQSEFSLFDEKFMEEVRKMKEKNLAVKLLEDLIRGRVRTLTRSNLVTGELFSNRFSETLNRYINGLLSNEEVIQELLKMAQEMMKAEQQGNDLGLTNEEKAFYDALTRPQAVKDFYSNEQLVELTKELTDMLRKNRTIDWNRRESERANMRRLVKRLLKKYKYPPEEAENAMNIVLKQCEQWRGGTKHIRKNTTQRKILNGRKKKNDDLTMSFHIFFVNLPKRRKRTKRRRHPAYADTQKGGCKTHIARMSVSHGTLCRHSRHLRTGRRRARLHNEHDNDGRAARQHDRKRHTYQLT